MKRLALIASLAALPVLAFAQAQRGIMVKSAQDSGVTEYDPARMHAIVIGINAYKYWPKLRGAAADARAVASTLHRYYAFPTNQVTLILDHQATRENLIEAFDASWRRLSDRDSLVIYYAGHGWKDDAGNGYWIPLIVIS